MKTRLKRNLHLTQYDITGHLSCTEAAVISRNLRTIMS